MMHGTTWQAPSTPLTTRTLLSNSAEQYRQTRQHPCNSAVSLTADVSRNPPATRGRDGKSIAGTAATPETAISRQPQAPRCRSI